MQSCNKSVLIEPVLGAGIWPSRSQQRRRPSEVLAPPDRPQSAQSLLGVPGRDMRTRYFPRLVRVLS